MRKTTKIISIINLKGGVGKTTLAVNVAALLAHEGKRTLLVDLDSQSNASVAVMSVDRYEEIDARGWTVATLFEDELARRWGNPCFDLQRSIAKGVGKLPKLDLLPSSMTLVELQDDLRSIRNPYCSPVDILPNAIAPVVKDYEYIIVDCPPNLGILTLNGFMMSDYYIVPTFTDFFAKYGIRLIEKRVATLRQRRAGTTIKRLGIVLSKVNERFNLYQTFAPAIRQANGDAVFKAEVRDRTGIGQATAKNLPLVTCGIAADGIKEALADIRMVKTEMLERIYSNPE